MRTGCCTGPKDTGLQTALKKALFKAYFHRRQGPEHSMQC